MSAKKSSTKRSGTTASTRTKTTTSERLRFTETTPKKRCKCIEDLNALLGKQNEELLISFRLDGSPERCIVTTQRKNPSKRTTQHTLVANFCPFCGVKYWDKE